MAMVAFRVTCTEESTDTQSRSVVRHSLCRKSKSFLFKNCVFLREKDTSTHQPSERYIGRAFLMCSELDCTFTKTLTYTSLANTITFKIFYVTTVCHKGTPR